MSHAMIMCISCLWYFFKCIQIIPYHPISLGSLVDIQNASSAGARSARAGQITSSTDFRLSMYAVGPGGSKPSQPAKHLRKWTQLVVPKSIVYCK